MINDPYTDPEKKAARAGRTAKLLRPKAKMSAITNCSTKAANKKLWDIGKVSDILSERNKYLALMHIHKNTEKVHISIFFWN